MTDKQLTHDEMLEIAEQRERENEVKKNAFDALDRLYDENSEALRRLATGDTNE